MTNALRAWTAFNVPSRAPAGAAKARRVARGSGVCRLRCMGLSFGRRSRTNRAPLVGTVNEPKGQCGVSERDAGSGPDLEGKLVGGRAEKARVDRGGRSGDVPQRGEILRRRDGPDGVSRVRLIDGDHLAVVGCIDQVEGEA